MRRRPRFTGRQQPVIVQPNNTEKPKSKLEQYLKYAPLGYLFLIVYSYAGLNAYYSVFGVDIINHITIQEMLINPIKESIESIQILIILLVILPTPFTLYQMWVLKTTKNSVILDSRFLFNLYVTMVATGFLVLIVYYIINLKSNVLSNTKDTDFPWVQAFIGFVIFIMFLLFIAFRNKTYNFLKLERFWPWLVLTVLLFLGLQYTRSYSRAVKILNNPLSQSVIIKKNMIPENKVYSLIGETSSILFIWSDSLKQVEAIQKKELYSITYINKSIPGDKDKTIKPNEPPMIVTQPDSVQVEN
ncbi:MAG: hypothetical protein HEP71_02015 [Roseivirga sp.]|nr:hypothetical protein [Roseivirga sp.]